MSVKPEPFLVYHPPKGGQAIRSRSPGKAWERVSAFLRACTDAVPDRPDSLELHLYEPSGTKATPWFRPAVKRAEAAFGPGTRRAWLTGTRNAFRLEWRLDPQQLGAALAFLAGGSPWPQTEIGPATVVVGYTFRWIDEVTRAVLPGQEDERRLLSVQATSDLLVWLGPRPSAIFHGRFPFGTVDAACATYVKRVAMLSPVRLLPSRFLLWEPTKRASALAYRISVVDTAVFGRA